MNLRRAALAAALGAAWPAAQGQAWSLESRWLARGEATDNVGLAGEDPKSERRLVLEAAGNLTRESEIARTRLEGGLTLRMHDRPFGRDLQGRLALGHSLQADLDTLNLAGDVQRDDPRDDRRNVDDVIAGATQRTSTSAAAGWSHALTERWSAGASVADSRVRFGGNADRADYGNRSLGVFATRRWDEMTTSSVRMSRSDYALTTGRQRSRSDILRLTVTRSFDERSTLTAGLGRYRTRREQTFEVQVCPLPASFCDAGLVARVPALRSRDSVGQGWQYEAGAEHALGLRTRLAASAARDLAPGAAGVLRNDTMAVTLTESIAPTLRATFAWQRASTRPPDAEGAARPRLDTLDGSLGWDLGERLSLVAGATWRRLDDPGTGSRAVSRSISISLQYQPQKIVANR